MSYHKIDFKNTPRGWERAHGGRKWQSLSLIEGPEAKSGRRCEWSLEGPVAESGRARRQGCYLSLGWTIPAPAVRLSKGFICSVFNVDSWV